MLKYATIAKTDLLILTTEKKLVAEVANLTATITSINNLLIQSQADMSSLSPRAFIGRSADIAQLLFMLLNLIFYPEYVETFQMPPNVNKSSRAARWENFLSNSTSFGGQLLNCFMKENPSWGNAKQIAQRISGIYQLNSQRYHATSHELENGISLVIEQGNITIQQIKMMKCTARTFGLTVTFE